MNFQYPREKGITQEEISNEKTGKCWRTTGQGLKRQLIEAGDFDGWPAEAIEGS